MICDVCGTYNKDSREFCKECGNALAITCRSCDAGNEPDDRF